MDMEHDSMENVSIPRVNPDDSKGTKDNEAVDSANDAKDVNADTNDTSSLDTMDGDSDKKGDSLGSSNTLSEKSNTSGKGTGSDDEKPKDSSTDKSDGSSDGDEKKDSSNDSSDGSSKKSNGNEEEEDKDEKKKKKQKEQMAKQAAHAGVQYGIKAYLAAKLMSFMKLMMLFCANVANTVGGIFSAILGAIWGGIQTAAGAVVSFFSSAAAGIANFLGVSVTVVTVSLVGVVVAPVAAVGMFIVSLVTDSSTARTDIPVVNDCMAGVKIAADELADVQESVNVSVEMETNARTIYFAYKELGLTDNMIAGALGNFQAECSIDPTLVEGMYTEHFNINGPKHKEGLGDDPAHPDRDKLDAWTRKFAESGFYFETSNGKGICGFGLGQWTGPGGEDFLNAAEKQGVAWYDLNYQITHSIKGYRPGFFEQWVKKYNPENGVVKRSIKNGKQSQFKNTPQDMGTYFSYFYEGQTKYAQDDRRKYAAQWVVYFPDWEAGRTEEDTANAQSILAAAEATQITAAEAGVKKASNGCVNSGDVFAGGNGSIAEAGASFAYAKKEQAVGNNGTALYKSVCDKVIGDNLYQSCDHCVCAAVRWSGADDSFPPCDTTTQAQYLAGATDKWQEITDYNGDISKLQPGDVLIITAEKRGRSHGHVVLFAGYDAIKAAHPEIKDANTTIVAASLGERSAGCQTFYDELKLYTAYRNIKMEDNSKYKNVLSDQRPDSEVGNNGDKAPEAGPAPDAKG